MAISRRDFIKTSAGLAGSAGLSGVLASGKEPKVKEKSAAGAGSLKRSSNMRKVKIQKLTLEGFKKYGGYANLINPNAPKLGGNGSEYYPDLISMDLGIKSVQSASICRAFKCPPIVDIAESHTHSTEAMMALDSDMVMHFGIPTPSGVCPVDTMEVFHIPKGTIVVMKHGTWHYAPFCYGSDVTNILVLLPPRTYVNDCTTYKFREDERFEIAGL